MLILVRVTGPPKARFFNLEVEANDTIDKVKTMIMDKTDILKVRQGLTYRGWLDDGRTLEEVLTGSPNVLVCASRPPLPCPQTQRPPDLPPHLPQHSPEKVGGGSALKR